MSTYFDWLPEELLIEIFIHVEKESIKNLIEISPFDSLISKCSSWKNIFRIAFSEIDILDILNLKNNIYNYLHTYYISLDIYDYLFKYNYNNYSLFRFDVDVNTCVLGKHSTVMEKFLIQLEQFLSSEVMKYIAYYRNRINIDLHADEGDSYFIYISVEIPIGYSGHVTTSRHPLTRTQFFNLLFLREYCMS